MAVVNVVVTVHNRVVVQMMMVILLVKLVMKHIVLVDIVLESHYY